MFCKNCGNEIQEDWSVCPNCGIKLKEENERRNQDNEQIIKNANHVHQNQNTPKKKKSKLKKVGIIIIAIIIIYMLFQIPESSVTDMGKPSTDPDDYYEGYNYHVVDENSQEDTGEPSQENPDESQTVEEYLNSCIAVTPEELNRNPDRYIGENILLEGSFSTVMDSLFIGLWEGQGGVEVKYEGKSAYDTNGVEVGNVISGDYGYAAGIYQGEDDFGTPYMDCQIVILTYQEE